MRNAPGRLRRCHEAGARLQFQGREVLCESSTMELREGQERNTWYADPSAVTCTQRFAWTCLPLWHTCGPQ